MGLIAINPNGGLGMYPTNTDGSPNACFDPSRPFYMPYWWDTWEEGQCKYAGVPIIGSIVGGPTLNPAAGGTPANPAGGLDSTISGLAGIVIVLGLASMILNLYMSRR